MGLVEAVLLPVLHSFHEAHNMSVVSPCSLIRAPHRQVAIWDGAFSLLLERVVNSSIQTTCGYGMCKRR